MSAPGSWPLADDVCSCSSFSCVLLSCSRLEQRGDDHHPQQDGNTVRVYAISCCEYGLQKRRRLVSRLVSQSVSRSDGRSSVAQLAARPSGIEFSSASRRSSGGDGGGAAYANAEYESRICAGAEAVRDGTATAAQTHGPRALALTTAAAARIDAGESSASDGRHEFGPSTRCGNVVLGVRSSSPPRDNGDHLRV